MQACHGCGGCKGVLGRAISNCKPPPETICRKFEKAAGQPELERLFASCNFPEDLRDDPDAICMLMHATGWKGAEALKKGEK